MKRFLSFLAFTSFLLVACSSTPTPDLESTEQVASATTLAAQPTETPPPPPTATPTPTATPAPTDTPVPTATPRPQFNPNSFVFPYHVPDLSFINQIPDAQRFMVYHITHRPNRDDPCGRHPGDVITPLGAGTRPDCEINIPVQMPYDGELVRSWTTEKLGPDTGGDLAFTFYVGDMDGYKLFLDVYHTDTSPLQIGDKVSAGQVFARLDRAKNNGGYWEAKVHFTLLPVKGDQIPDFMSSESTDIAPYAIPPTLRAGSIHGQPVVIVYEGPNYCNMTSREMIAAILDNYLPDAGFCIDGNLVTYCGGIPDFHGLAFSQQALDERSVILHPQSQ